MRTHLFILERCAALVLAGAAAAACDGGNPSQPTPVARDVPVSAAVPAGDWGVNAQLTVVKQATARFHDLAAAQASGYSIENEPCVASPAGGMGIHAPNLPLILDPTLDLSKPELLLYEPRPNGGHRLVGVEYFQAVILRNKTTGIESPRLETAPWDPDEYEIVNPRPSLLGQQFHLTPPPAPQVPWHWSLHVWIWAHNPSGMFAEWNPAIQCA
jgi:hypothetical protein